MASLDDPTALDQAHDALLAERHTVLRLYDRLLATYRELLGPFPEQTEVLLDRAEHRLAEPAPTASDDLVPILVGGTGRSGTSTVARLLRQHSSLVGSPRELRFHVSTRRGLPTLMDGRCSVEQFAETMRTHWFRRPSAGGDGADIGLYADVTAEQLEHALAELERAWVAEPGPAARQLLELVPRALLADDGHGVATGWVEHSPENILLAPRLYRIMPDARFVHSVRDGRDVASSILRRQWGPDDLVTGVRWWGHRVVRCAAQAAALPSGRVHLLHLEDLVVRDREPTLARLLEFAGIDEEPAIRAAFDDRLVPTSLHLGRWRDDVPEAELDTVSLIYRGVLERLRRVGVPVERFLVDLPELDDELVELEADRQELYELRIEHSLLMKENTELAAVLSGAELIGVATSRADCLARLRGGLGQEAGDLRPQP